MGERALHLGARNSRHHSYLGHCLIAETNNGLHGTDRRVHLERFLQTMPCHIKIAETKLTCASVRSVVSLRSVHLIEQLLRQGLACLIVLCKGIQELFLIDEVLVKLRGQLHKVARYIRSALRCVLATGQHAV